MSLLSFLILSLSYPFIVTKLYVKIGFEILLINLTWVTKTIVNPLELRSLISKLIGDSVETQMILLNELNESLEDLCEWNHVGLSIVKFLFQYEELFITLGTLFIVIGCLNLCLDLVKRFVCFRGGNQHDESLIQIGRTLSKLYLVKEKKERFDYYCEHLEGLVEAVETDLSTPIEKKK